MPSAVSILLPHWLGRALCVYGKFLNFEICAKIPIKRQCFYRSLKTRPACYGCTAVSMLDTWGLELVFGVGWSSSFTGRDYYNCNEPENDLPFLPVVF